MCRSSRFLAFLALVPACCLAAASASARMGGGVGVPFAPMGAGVRPGVMTGINPGVAPNVHTGVLPGVRGGVFPNVRTGLYPNVRPGINRGYYTGGLRGRFGRFGRGGRFGFGDGVGGFGDFDTAYGADDPGLYDGGLGDGGGYGPPSFIPAARPPRCQHPLIIAIGRGLRHQVQTHVVYGSPPRCVP